MASGSSQVKGHCPPLILNEAPGPEAEAAEQMLPASVLLLQWRILEHRVVRWVMDTWLECPAN